MFHQVREILSLHIGQAGIQVGSAIFEQYCAEHKIDTSGNGGVGGENFLSFFDETAAAQFVPRCLFFDSEAGAIGVYHIV